MWWKANFLRGVNWSMNNIALRLEGLSWHRPRRQAEFFLKFQIVSFSSQREASEKTSVKKKYDKPCSMVISFAISLKFSLMRNWYLNIISWRFSGEVWDQGLKAALAASTAFSISIWDIWGTFVTTSFVAGLWTSINLDGWGIKLNTGNPGFRTSFVWYIEAIGNISSHHHGDHPFGCLRGLQMAPLGKILSSNLRRRFLRVLEFSVDEHLGKSGDAAAGEAQVSRTGHLNEWRKQVENSKRK